MCILAHRPKFNLTQGGHKGDNSLTEIPGCPEKRINDRKIARQSTLVSFIDMCKAFDTVPRNMLHRPKFNLTQGG
jgi:hypothetical protein